jgi:hypothetical protein
MICSGVFSGASSVEAKPATVEAVAGSGSAQAAENIPPIPHNAAIAAAIALARFIVIA